MIASRRRAAADARRLQWASQASELLGLPASAWDAPACAALCEAVEASADPTAAVRRFALQRAALGFTLAEVAADLQSLAGIDPLAGRCLDRAEVGLALADVLHEADAPGCTDPLTLLPDRSYLQARIGELRRTVASLGIDPGQVLGLVCVRLPGTRSFGELAGRAIATADVLRSRFDRGETVAALSSRLFAVLVTDRQAVSIPGLEADAAIWMEPLPVDPWAVHLLVDDLVAR